MYNFYFQSVLAFLFLLLLASPSGAPSTPPPHLVRCSSLLTGQYLCPDPDPKYLQSMVDPATEQLRGCTKENRAPVRCVAVEGLQCEETGNGTFFKEAPCEWTNGTSFETTLLLSIFLGMFGADRFYLGYPAIGLAKFCTLGFMFVGQLVDVVLIATQVVGPADGSAYVVPYYGPRVSVIKSDNFTYRLRQDDW